MRNLIEQNMEAESEAYKRWDFVSGLEERVLKQKSKMYWLDVGDMNNKVFQSRWNRPLKEVNVTCCLNLIWRVTTCRSLWVQWVKVYLLEGDSFWEVQSNSTLRSWMWQKLL